MCATRFIELNAAAANQGKFFFNMAELVNCNRLRVYYEIDNFRDFSKISRKFDLKKFLYF